MLYAYVYYACQKCIIYVYKMYDILLQISLLKYAHLPDGTKFEMDERPLSP